MNRINSWLDHVLWSLETERAGNRVCLLICAFAATYFGIRLLVSVIWP